jgi:hypothetical protein
MGYSDITLCVITLEKKREKEREFVRDWERKWKRIDRVWVWDKTLPQLTTQG